jgi:hypothetical protein
MQLLRDKGISKFRSRVHVIESDREESCEEEFRTGNRNRQRYSRSERTRVMLDEIFASTFERVFLRRKLQFVSVKSQELVVSVR